MGNGNNTIYCKETLDLMIALREFIHILFPATGAIWGMICIPKVIRAVMSGL